MPRLLTDNQKQHWLEISVELSSRSAVILKLYSFCPSGSAHLHPG